MDIEYLQMLQESDEYKGVAQKGNYTLNWNPTKPSTYIVRPLPPDEVKCPKGIGFQSIHWGKWTRKDKNSPVLCNTYYTILKKKEYMANRGFLGIVDKDYYNSEHIVKFIEQGGKFPFEDEICWACNISSYLRNVGKDNKKISMLGNSIKDTPTLYIPAYLPKVKGAISKNQIVFDWEGDAFLDPNVVCWNVSSYYLKKLVSTVINANEFLSDKDKGKFLLFTITEESGEKRYPGMLPYPLKGSIPIHPNPEILAKILGDLYPNIIDIMGKVPHLAPDEMKKRLFEMDDYKEYLVA